MTTDDFSQISSAIARVTTQFTLPGRAQGLAAVESVARELAFEFAVADQAFDRSGFLAECGFPPES